MSLEQNALVMHRDTLLVIPDNRIADAYLQASMCTNCQTYWMPHFEICPTCLSRDFLPKELSREGSLYSYTTVYSGYPGFTVPYMLGYVDFPEGVRLIGQIECTSSAELRMDMKMMLYIGIIKHKNDQPVYSWKFKPIF